MSRITIAQLEAFHWTATLGTVERAAKRLNLAQPTVSLRLKGLEEAIGKPLFDRSGRSVRLTPVGRELMPEAHGVLLSIERIAQHGEVGDVAGPIRIGVAEGFAMVCLSQILERLQTNYPRLQPELIVATSMTLETELHKTNLDLGILVSPTAAPGFTLVPFGAQATGWIAGSGWDLPQIVRPADLADRPVIANPPNTASYRQTIAWFGAAELTPSRLVICSSVAMQAHIIDTGAAAGIYPVKMAESAAEAGRVRILATDPPIQDVPVCAKYAEGQPNPAVGAVLESVREVLRTMNYMRPLPSD
ncbi:LysR family transcriptional regulator [Acuticoccus sp. I52.16.1]|uniref:LysR family transcriptional regulator n=1 Tax=Acuticoccus sp. I52.16.1 TaxID=2928472 RepID=UPI001FCFE5AB|nr:LysR family transcriptional regulator [Acuticoccus sp. I52.16.1]UOM32608.1 LysR family transcriptional regulator [Acuticoccus sp. I52.16.1]